ncbi:metallophosphoesterase [Pseudoflavonifractor capillosus]|uniref:metallophosphoesterase n=1 Tax=Pseudoflavonifractor capillosus TaxID=106588 RepID=UPI00195C9146|nr:metallophosphoesterase [Pseudoflavonifractor capillosus]MBM6897745.1 metallophosphoesterase [Pseudoflavonifractor capillosus]
MARKKATVKRIGSLCLAGALGLGLIPVAQAQPTGEELKICVMSDTHYYPLNYVSDCQDYTTYVNGDPKMLAESGSIFDAAVDIIEQDQPDIVLISGDLTKDGEKQGHLDVAAKLQALENEAGIDVFVINGNHDVYNYTDACTFENGKKESAETVTPDEFKKLYAKFGYNGDFNAQYYTPPQGKQAGGLSYTVTYGDYVILAMDSGMYSPDATGMETNEHITAGRLDEDLMVWAVDQIEAAEAQGKTVIGLMHHGLLPHFENEDKIVHEYVVENWQESATTLADAGLRYIFTGHMHANDVAEFTTVSGNTIYDLETGSLASWGSPVRTVTLEKGEPLNDGTKRTHETFTVTSQSVKTIVYQGENIEDFAAYTKDKLYPEKLFNNMANGMLTPMLKEIGQVGIRAYVAQLAPELDLNGMILDMAREYLVGGMEIELGSGIGRVHVSYRNGGIQLDASGTAGWALGPMTITDEQIIRMVDDLLGKVEQQYIQNPDYLLGKVDELVTKISTTGVAPLDTPEEKSLYDLVVLLLTGHYQGAEDPPQWVESAREYIRSGVVVKDLVDLLVGDVSQLAEEITSNLSVDTGIAFSGLWKTAIDSQTDNGNVKATLDLVGLDINETINDLVSEYMSESFLTGMGSLVDDILAAFLYDDTLDDVEGDPSRSRTITFDGTRRPQAPSVENGLLPDQITMTLGQDPQTSRAFSWYTGKTVTSGVVQVSDSPDFSHVVAEATATTQTVTTPKTLLNLGLLTNYTTQERNRHTALVTGLEPGKTYYYRLGCQEEGYWSDPVSFELDEAGDDTFSFLYVNDSQGMVLSDYQTYLNTLAQADATFPDASFLLHSGDFVDDGSNEDYWNWVLDSNVSASLATAPAAGNHEDRSSVEGVTVDNALMSHFNLQNLPQQDTSTGVYYSFVYENATFIVLNTNDLTQEETLSPQQYNWAYETAQNADTQWKIILMHKSPYSNGPHGEDSDVIAIREQLDQLCATCDIDLVLSGHDHVYNRTPYLAYGTEQSVQTQTVSHGGHNYQMAMQPSGTLFLIAGTAGVKNYRQESIDTVPSAVEAGLDQDSPVYTGIEVVGDRLYYRAYRVTDQGTSELIDSFAIDKESEVETPAWQKVVDQIGALPQPADITTAHEGAITQARNAYDALSAQDQALVSNYASLEQAEQMLRALQSIAGGQSRTVNSKSQFVEALNDSSVTEIVASGTIEFENFWGNEREYTINRNLRITGSATLKFVEFHITNGATLILDGSIYIDDTRTQGSTYGSLNPIEIYGNSTLVTKGSVQLRTEYGRSGSSDGFGVKFEEGGTVYWNSTGSCWGAEGAMFSSPSNSKIVVNAGTLDRKNDNHPAIDTNGSVEVNGGEISDVFVAGTFTLNGGTIGTEVEGTQRYPVTAKSTSYLTGGTILNRGGRTIDLRNTGKMYILTDTWGKVVIGDYKPYVGQVETDNYRDITISYRQSNGSSGSDGIYETDTAANTPQGMAGVGGTRLNTQLSNDGSAQAAMSAALDSGTHTVYGKYYLVGDGKSAPTGMTGTGGSAEAIVYGPTRTVENYPVTRVEIVGDETRVVAYQEGGSLLLQGMVIPANAFDNALVWESGNGDVATIGQSGMVSLTGVGKTVITLRAQAYPDLTDQMTLYAVTPTLTGPDTLELDGTGRYSASLGWTPGADDPLTIHWSVSDGTVAAIDQSGALTPLGIGTTKVTAEVYLDDKPTGIQVTQDVSIGLEVTQDTLDNLVNITLTDANTMEGDPDKTFQDLLPGSYTVGQPQLVGGDYHIPVTLERTPYLEVYNGEHGTHYFMVENQDTITVTLVCNVDTGAFSLLDPAQAALDWEVVCLTLRPMRTEIYPGGDQLPTPYIETGMFYVYHLDKLQELYQGGILDFAYFNADGQPVTQGQNPPGEYTVKLTVDGEPVETLTITYQEQQLTYNVRPGTLVLRYINDQASEHHEVFTPDQAQASTDREQPFAAAQDTTQFYINGHQERETDFEDVSLMFDDILSSYGDNNPQQDLVEKAKEQLNLTLDPDHTQFKYMDLVDSTSDNAWVSASQRITVFWPYPEGTDQNTPFTLLRYDGVNRQYGLGGDESYQDQMQAVTVTQLTQEEKSATVQQLEHGLLLTIQEFTPAAYALSWQPTVSVDVTWGSLSYTYNPGTWNPDTHQYDGRGWTADQEGGDRITLVNQGAADVAVTAGYTAEENYTSGGTFQVDGVSVNGSQSLPAATDGTPSSLIFTFLPTGDPVAQQFEGQKIGTITMTIGDVS